MEHDRHHGGEISLILGMHGLQALDLWSKKFPETHMNPKSVDINRILELLSQGPVRIEKATSGFQPAQLSLQTDKEPCR